MTDTKKEKYFIWGLIALAMLLVVFVTSTCNAQLNGNFNTIRVKAGNDTATFSPQPNGTILYGNSGTLWFKTGTNWTRLTFQDTVRTQIVLADSIHAHFVDIDSTLTVDSIQSRTINNTGNIQSSTVSIEQTLTMQGVSGGAPSSSGGLLFNDTFDKLLINENNTVKNVVQPNYYVDPLTYLGSTIKGQSIQYQNATSTLTLTAARLQLVGIYIRGGTTVTGVKWFQTQAGNITPSDSNKVALYSYSAGTYTLIAQSISDGTIWNNLGLRNKAFQTPVSITVEGTYFIGLIYNRSVEVAPPILAPGATMNVSPIVDFTNSAKMYALLNAQTTTPANTTGGAITLNQVPIWVTIY